MTFLISILMQLKKIYGIPNKCEYYNIHDFINQTKIYKKC